ncbi:MAG: hypothetical protein OSB41_12535 [Kiritimatiellae bacterium]|nr:hypothetical protein [Kiritimatiellia bacterium]
MIESLIGLLALAALSMLATLCLVRRRFTAQQRQIDELIDVVNDLESKVDTELSDQNANAVPPPLP